MKIFKWAMIMMSPFLFDALVILGLVILGYWIIGQF